jgi:uncharacterized phiE125 gp8 family phage protein
MESIVRIVTPPDSSILASLDDLRADLGITDGAQDPRLTKLLAEASAEFQTECKRVFGNQTIEQTFRQPVGFHRHRAREADPLILDSFPVSSITSISEDGAAALAEADYEIDPASGEVWRLHDDIRSPWCSAKIVVTYIAGYVLPNDEDVNLPADIQSAVRELATASYYGAGVDPNVRQLEVAGVGSETRWVGNPNGGAPYPETIQRTIDRYQNLRV